MKQYVAGLVVCVGFLFACQYDKQQALEGEDRIEGVRTENISDIVRMPVTASGASDSSSAARMTFEDRLFHFDTIFEGDVVKHSFQFQNTGKTSLLINNVRTTCGCTTPSWPKEPVAPGEESEIVVQFNSAGKSGVQNKDITIYANTYPNTTVLKVYGFVEKSIE